MPVVLGPQELLPPQPMLVLPPVRPLPVPVVRMPGGAPQQATLATNEQILALELLLVGGRNPILLTVSSSTAIYDFGIAKSVDLSLRPS